MSKELIAQEPIPRRDESRLLVVNKKDKNIKESVFKHIVDFLDAGDVLVLNNTRVLPARLFARRKTGGKLEVLLLKEKETGLWEVLVKPGRKARLGDNLIFGEGKFHAQVLDKTPTGGRLLKFNPSQIKKLINQYGKMPLPNYIKKDLRLPNRYQTIYAREDGAVAAPTAGLHFTENLLEELHSRGVEIAYITLHCGLATFRPVKSEDIRNHPMECEYYRIDANAARIINKAKRESRRVIAVGTTVVRAVETAALRNQGSIYYIQANQGETGLYIYPGYRFKIINALLTNFHLPHSTNLILVSAFAGSKLIKEAYRQAIKKRFRFYSFGDAMLII